MSRSEITKSALAASLRELMKEKRLHQITIKDITAQCKISRNAFYYHFHDKYDLASWIFCSEALPLIDSSSSLEGSWRGFIALCQHLHKNRDFYSEVFHYKGQNSLFDTLENIYFEMMKIYISNACRQINSYINEEQQSVVARMYSHAFAGTIADWIKSGMPVEEISCFEKLNAIKPKLSIMFLGMVEDRKYANFENTQQKLNAPHGGPFSQLKQLFFPSPHTQEEIYNQNTDSSRLKCMDHCCSISKKPISINHSTKAACQSTPVIDYHIPAAQRGINMLLAKFHGKEFRSEVPIAYPQSQPAPVLKKKLSDACIMFITDGGLVPRGNPDNLVPIDADSFYVYSFEKKHSLLPEDYEISHQGYENRFVLEDPNRLIPLDAARIVEFSGQIGKISEFFYSTTGVMVSVEQSKKLGQKVATSVAKSGVDGVFLISTCGTSTRCGAYIASCIEHAGIPVVHVTNLIQISEGIGCNRILQGNSINYPFGHPDLSPTQERIYRLSLFKKGLELMNTVPKKNSCLILSLAPESATTYLPTLHLRETSWLCP